jgi:hypothetical protein
VYFLSLLTKIDDIFMVVYIYELAVTS